MVGFCFMNLDNEVGKELVALDNEGLYFSKLSGTGGASGAWSFLSSVSSGTSVVAGDIDRDGVDDLVIGSDFGLHVRLGIAVQK
jgi:hypothetical protein